MTRRPAWFSFDVLRFPERLVCDAEIVLERDTHGFLPRGKMRYTVET
jgi:hypothetical protein